MDVLGFLADVCVDFFVYVVSECEANGIEANANTEANYSTYVSGDFEYNWRTPDGTTIETMPFTLSSGMSDLEVVGNSTIRWLAGVYDSDTPDITVQQVGNDIDIRTTAQMHLYINGNLVDVSNFITSSCRISSGYQATYGYDSSGTYYYYPNDTIYGRSVIGHLSGVRATSNQTLSNNYPDAVYIPAPSTGTISYNDYILQIIDWTTINYPDLNITIDDLPSWAELASETETETESECCCNCNTTIYVNADGSLTIQNDISGDFDLSINNDADLSLNINAAAGAFGAGAIVIDPDAEINITAGAGAFGAGAFGAGAIVSPDVNISGDLSVGDISGEVNLQVSEVSFDVSGGDINIDQSGSTVTNNYNTTNNYYGTTEPIEPDEPFTIDYDEILSEGELESILTQETYDIDTFPTDFIDGDNLILPSKPAEDYLPVAMQATPDLLNAFSDLIVDTGCSSFYFPLGIFSVLCYCIRGHR